MNFRARNGFTLIELLLVIALIAIVSTLAVGKLGGVKEAAARKISLANQQAIGRGVEAYLAIGNGHINRLDSLIYAGGGGAPQFGTTTGFDFDTPSTDAGNGLYLGPVADCLPAVREETNGGLTPGLQKVLCLYTLSQGQADALSQRLGLCHVMAHTAYADAGDFEYPSMHYGKDRAYGDGTVPNASDGLKPNESACVATAVTNGMIVAAINPMTDLGRTIYQAMGQELMNTENWNRGGKNTAYDENEVKREVNATGGPLLAFGLGDSASIIGNSQAGLEVAPYATYAQKKYYSRYILLFRLRSTGAGSVSVVLPEFAGVLDCCGNTIRAARQIVADL